MTDQLFAMEEAASGVEFIGFEAAPLSEPVKGDGKKPGLPAPAKRRRRRAVKPGKRAPVRVWFDDRELLKLNGRAAAQGVTLPEYLRLRALRDTRGRGRQVTPSGDDLFVRADLVQMTVVRLRAGLAPELEERITTYFSRGDRFSVDPAVDRPWHGAVSPRPKAFGRLAQFLTDLVGARWPAHRTVPPAGT